MRSAMIFVIPFLLSLYDAAPVRAFPDLISDVDLTLARQLRDKCATTNDRQDCQKLLEFNESFSKWEGSISSYPDVFFLNSANSQPAISK